MAIPNTTTKSETVSAVSWRFGDCVLDGRSLELTVRGALVALEPKPLMVLRFLLRRAGEVVTKDELQDEVWPGRILSESVLTKTVARLRLALADEDQNLIRTMHGFGYRLAATVTVETPAGAARSSLLNLIPGDAPPLRPNFQLLRPLGDGGFGEVWLAEHRKTREQRVFKFGRDVLQVGVLKREITLYRLLHDTFGARRDFVRLLDWNLEEPPFFIETEYLPAGSLADWAEHLGGIDKLPLAQRLELIAQIAEALAAAHSAGVLHKDLKPSNVLIDLDRENAAATPQIKLVDFGSGRLVDLKRLEALEITRLGFTQVPNESGSSSGTPVYMAPEVYSGQLPTVQSDIYALGVLLYQMIVGDLKRPLAAGWEREVDDALLREDVALAAEGNPARRLTDAAQLAERLRTLPARHAERAAAQARRVEAEALRQALATATARRQLLRAVAIALSIGLALSLWQFVQARREQAAAQVAATEARAIASFVTDDLLHFADPLEVARPQLSVHDVLDEAGDRLRRRLPNQPLAQAQILKALGTAYEGLGGWGKAREQLQSALVKAEEVQGSTGDMTLHIALTLAYVQVLDGAYDESQKLYDRVLAQAPRLGEANPLILDARDGRAFLQYERGDYQMSAKSYEDLRADLERLHQTDRLIDVNWSLPDVYLDIGREVEAEALIREAITATEARLGPDHPRVLWMRLTLGDALMGQRKWDAADAEYLHSLAGLTATLGAQHPYTLTALHYHGHLLQERGDYAAALPVLRHAYAGRRAAHGDNHPYTRYSAHRLGQVLTRLGQLDEAIPLLEATLRSAEAAQSASNPDALDFRCSLAEALLAAHQTDRARALMDEGLPWAKSVLPPVGPRLQRYLDVQRRVWAG